MSPFLEVFLIYLIMLFFNLWNSVDALVFYIEEYDVNKEELHQFLQSMRLLKVVTYYPMTFEAIVNWLYSKPYPFGVGGRTGRILGLTLLLIMVIAYIMLNLRLAIMDGEQDRVTATVIFTIAMSITLYKTHYFGSKLKYFAK